MNHRAALVVAFSTWLLTNLNAQEMEKITLGGGCFWCVEAVYQSLNGVESAVSGYMGGHIKNPAYREVCTGRTGHAEVVQLSFDPDVLAWEDVFAVFFTAHDPTTLNRQGADVGTQYRSAIFYHSEAGKVAAEAALSKWNQADAWDGNIVTTLEAAPAFYPAEDYHQQYYELNGEAPYCRAVIAPKMKKVQTQFAPLFKSH
jgi:methionine-S-sulfoxide reductase